MDINRRQLLFTGMAAATTTICSSSSLAQGGLPTAQPIAAQKGPEIKVTELATGLVNPWAVCQLPDGRFLVSERSGRMLLVTPSGMKHPVGDVLAVFARVQGGLLDVVLSPRFASDATLFYSFAEPVDGGLARTAVARARLAGERLVDTAVIFRQSPAAPGGFHFGSRLVFDRSGHLFVTTGDRYQLSKEAQNLNNHIGKVLRITVDGKPAPGNPFLNRADAMPEIWSYGHRNMQGAALHPLTGQLWTNEHGPRGGDEINLTEAGKNYGWPTITHGVDYSGAIISPHKAAPGMEQPVHVWVPSIAVSGLCFDSRETQGNRTAIWVGGLRSQLIAKISVEGRQSVSEVRYLEGKAGRVRAVYEKSPGKLLLLTDSGNGRLLEVDV